MPLPKGFKFTQESRLKMSLSGKGRIFSDEHRKNMSLAMTGKKRLPFSKEWIRKLSEARQGKASPNKGKKLSEEIRKKISLSLIGKNNPFYGKKHSEATKQKIREARLGKPSPLRGTKRPDMVGENNPAKSLEAKKKIGDARRGSKNNMWKGGISPINVVIRNSTEMRLWRKSVFERDDYTCVWCGARNGNGKAVVLQADHIKPFAYFPELRFEIDNGRTLCIACHKKTESYGWKKYNLTK